MKTHITIFLFLSFLSIFSQVPSNNAYIEKYGSAPAWTNEILWDNAVSVTEFGYDLYWDSIVNMAMQTISNNGGGVLFFPEGTYNFKNDLQLLNGVILRGPTPTYSNAKTDSFAPPAKLVFPQYIPIFADSGTPNSKAFKKIYGYGIENAGLVNLDINRGRIAIGSSGLIRSRNILLFGVRQNNIAEPQTDIPNAYPHMHKWQRFSYRHTRNVSISVKENASIINCRINDFTNNLYNPISNDSYDQPGSIVYGHFKGYVGGDLSKPTGGIYDAANPDDTVHIRFGYMNSFNYTDHYGIGLSAAFIGPDTVSRNYNQNLEIIDNWTYTTMRVAIFGEGYGLVIRGNKTTDLSGKRVFMDPTGRYVNKNNSATYENRSLNFAGERVTIENNDMRVYRHAIMYSGYSSVDGEGILIQTQDNYGNMMEDIFIRNNTVNSYIGIYDVKVNMFNLWITGNNLLNAGNIFLFKKEETYPVDNLFIENNYNLTGISVGYKVTNSQYNMNGNNIFIQNNFGTGGFNYPCQSILSNNIGFTSLIVCSDFFNKKIKLTPYNGEKMVDANTPISIDFYEPIIPGSLSGVTITGATIGSVANIALTISGNKLNIDHDIFTYPGEVFTVNIPTGVIKSQTGLINNIALSWTFKVAYKPYPIQLYPSDSTLGVKFEEPIFAVFDQKIIANDLSGIQILNEMNAPLAGVSASLDTTTNKLLIQHADFEITDHHYTIIIPASTVKNESNFYNNEIRWTIKTRGSLLYVSMKDLETILPIKIHPNPTSALLSIDGAANSTLTIYNIQGKKLLSTNTKNKLEVLNLTQLPSGNYILEICSDNSRKTIKFIKK